MSRTVTINEFILILRGFQRRIDTDAKKYPEEVLRQIRRMIVRTRTIDTAQTILTYDYKEFARGVNHNFLIEPDQAKGRYEGFVEFDRPTYGTRGRFFVKQGIEASDFQSISNEITFAAFR